MPYASPNMNSPKMEAQIPPKNRRVDMVLHSSDAHFFRPMKPRSMNGIPYPMSPTIRPKKMGMVSIMVMAGSNSRYLGVESILAMNSNLRAVLPFSLLVGISSTFTSWCSSPSSW
ncbi:MAG: hypothetical protein A4E29_00016 [Methanomassiliicoccales archaeon PtaB.Bin134]|nr:MAG: hypothetical protein A4E29_00016 [Methanomassiliicoccales archaeon PtaB.Bin134]